jgi:hypothetical protein
MTVATRRSLIDTVSVTGLMLALVVFAGTKGP